MARLWPALRRGVPWRSHSGAGEGRREVRPPPVTVQRQAGKRMTWSEQVKAFGADLLLRRWDRVEPFLRNVLESTSYEVMDSVDFGDSEAMLLMLTTLLHTGLGKKTSQGRYLFTKLLRKAWAVSNEENRWKIICFAAFYYDFKFDKPYNPGVCQEYFYKIADVVGVIREEVMSTISVKTELYRR